jgi:CubicO group peptidase (beta-lactamase class C family)
MYAIVRLCSLAAAAVVSAVLWTATTMAQAPANIVSLDGDLAPYLDRFKLPAVAAAVVKSGKILAAGAVGTRRIGTDTPVTINDRFHIGSDTKAMTSLLAGMLVEEGKLRWDTTVGEIYPELADKMSKGVKDITLEQLLSHTSGIPGDSMEHVPLISFSVTDDAGNLDAMRYTLVTRLVPLPLHGVPGERFEYSNLGYTLAGAIMERITGKTWEELVVAQIFDPLKLTSAGFGPQSSPGRVDAPLGHAADKDGKMRAFLAGPWGDNPLVIGPGRTGAHVGARLRDVGGLERRGGQVWAAAGQARDNPQDAYIRSSTCRRNPTRRSARRRQAVMAWAGERFRCRLRRSLWCSMAARTT